MRRPSPSLLLCIATATVLGTLAVVTGDLPERVPTHFDAAGRPDGWSTPTGFALLMGSLSGFLFLLFFGLGPLVARFPTHLLNLPHKAHWLAPERRADSLRAISDRLRILGAATQVLVLGLVLYSVRVSHSEPQPTEPDPTTWVLLAGFLGFVAAWLLSLHRRFPKPRGSDPCA